MEVRSGYQQTDVGVIPEEWDVVQLGDLKPFVTSGSRGWAAYYSKQGDVFVRITNLSRESIYIDLADCKFVKLPLEAREGIRTQLNEHDVLISITADIGIVGYVDARVSSPAYINQHIALVRFDPAKVSGKFVSYFLASDQPQKRFRAATDTGAKAGMSLPVVQKIQTALPGISEQRAIAEALSDVDALLDALNRLIVKKRDLKQAAMQQLLTGQTRLPGFLGEWEVKHFGEIAFPRHDKVDPKQTGMEEFCIELEHIAPETGELRGSTSTSGQSSLKSVFRSGDVLFGKLRAYLRKYWRANRSGVCSTEIWVFSPKDRLVTYEFLFQIIKTDEFIEAASNSYGTHMPRSDWNIVKNFEVKLPKLPEQTAIARVLSDMDAELFALEQRREKTRALKQAMMQELLTGKTRLL